MKQQQLALVLLISNTKQHKDNLANYYPDTYGYNLEASKTCFRNAINEMVSNGDVTLPYKGEMKIIWMNTGRYKRIWCRS